MGNHLGRAAAGGDKGASPVCAHLFISGRVQGIGFRESARRAALQRGVVGWVRNLLDGRVEAWLEGPSSAVQSMIAWCREGPPLARVDDVEITWEQPTGRYWTFSVTSNE
jgi:acylphosphatase